MTDSKLLSRKFGLAGVIVGAAVLQSAWPVALIALAIYSIANVAEVWATRNSALVAQHSLTIYGLANMAHIHQIVETPEEPAQAGAGEPEAPVSVTQVVPGVPMAHVGNYL